MEGAVRTSLDPTDFHFTTRERFRPFDLLAKNFVQLDDSFSTNTIGGYTILRPGPASEDDGVVTISNGKLRFSGQDDYYTVLKSGTGQQAPYETVIIDVASLAEGTVYAGLYKDENNYVHAYYDKSTNTVGLEARVNGTLYELGSTQPDPSDFGTSFRFAFVANENEVTALVGDSFMDIGDFRPLIKRDVRSGADETAWTCAARRCSRHTRTASARVPIRVVTSFSIAFGPDISVRPGCAIRMPSSMPTEPRT